MSVRVAPVYEQLLEQFAEREGIALGTLVRRVLEGYVREQVRTQSKVYELALERDNDWSEAELASIMKVPVADVAALLS